MSDRSLKINEIFYSIQGESSLVGSPTVFVRLTGCHLRCTYCDSKHSYFEGNKMSFAEIVEQIKKYECGTICVTGGEPLLQKNAYPFMKELCDLGFTVSLETSGACPILGVDPRVKIILDVKTPDSGEADSFLNSNLKNIPVNTEFKFVICSEKDFNWSEKFISENKISENYCVLYSPSFNKISEKWLAKKILSEKSKARLQLQLHKYIWFSHQRGI